MKTSTLLFACILLFSSSSLSAKPDIPTFSEPTDTLYLAEPVTETQVDCEPSEPKSRPDSIQNHQEKMMMPSALLIHDLCGMGIGAIDMTPDPMTTGPWNYMWSNGETTQDITGLTAGQYIVTVQSVGDGVVQNMSVWILEGPFVSANISGVVTGNTLCDGTSNGAIDVTATPIDPLVSYLWSNGATTIDLSNVPPGPYTISVTFGVTCTTTASFVVPNLTNFPTIPQTSNTADACDLNNGTAGVMAAGGVTPYSYLWSNNATSALITGLTAGEYTVTVTGANGCTNTAEVTVGSATFPVNVDDNSVISNTTCNGGNGSISIDVTPIGPTYTYLWDNGATTQNLTNLTSGFYRVTVTRIGSCTTTQVWYVEDHPILPEFTVANTSATCGMSNGGLNLTPAAGGFPPFTYHWSSGQTTQDLTNVPPGDYEVTLTASNGCTASGSSTIEDVPILFGYSGLVTDQTACDTINGKIVLSLFPANLAYQWSNGATTKTLFPLAPGDYTVTVSAGGTCTEVETFSVGDLREYPVIPIDPTPSTCGRANGSVDLKIFGQAATPLTYHWSNDSTTQDLSHLMADTFYVTVTSAVGCSAQNAVIVPNVNPPIGITGNVVDNISCAAPTGSIALNLMPLDTSYVYVWSGGQTTDSLSNLTAGTYTVTVTLGLSCIVLDTFDLISTALPPNLSAAGTSTNCGLTNGAADLSVSGGAGPFSYLWSNAATTEDLTNLAPGTYSVTVTGVNSCTAVTSADVLDNNIGLSVNGATTGNTSCTTANGALDISITPAGTYNYAWSNAATTEDISNLMPGSYTVTVSLGNCLSTNTFTIANNALPPNLAASSVAANCGLSDGAADLNVTGGVGPYTFIWSNAATTEDLANLLPGTYTVTVTGANGCTELSSANVLNNNIALNVNGVLAGNTSCTANNGSVDISITPAGTYTYLWSNAATTEDIASLNSGAYTVTVTLGTCQSTGSFSVNDNTATPVLDPNITASICSANNGAIDLTVSGPAGPYTYLWSNAETTEDLANLLPGNFAVTVTSANGCTQVANLNVPNNASNFSLAAAPTPLTNCAADNGAIDLSVTPAGAFTFLWSNMATTEDLNGLAPGTYTVSVTQSGSCTATASYFVVDQRTNPNAAQTIVPELCGQADGSIDLSVNGGTTPYSYLWDGSQTSQDLSNLGAGTYTVTVTDANNCTATASAVVPGNSISFSLAGTFTSNSSCLQNNGAIDLDVTPVAPGYTYLWSNAATDEDLSGLNAGTYTVTVSAGGNCTNTAVFNVSNNVPSPSLAGNITAGFCGQASGGIDLSVSGSPAPYTYIWSNQATTEDLSGIVSNTYSVTVTAANGCTSVDNFVVTENVFAPAIGSQLSSASSCVVDNGAIDLTISPAQTYTFLWSNQATTEDLANIAAGTYTVTVSGGGSCTNTAVLTVGSNTPQPSLSNNIAAATCGQASGSIDLSVTGSPTPYTYNWSNAATVEDLNNIVSGNYTVTVTSANGCTAVGNFTVQENVVTPVVNGTPTASSSCIVNNGSIDLIVGAGYTFLWSTQATTEDLANLAAGSYTVTVNGGGACTATASFTVTSNTPSPALSNNIAAATCGQASGSIDLSVTGSPTPYTYNWSNAATVQDLNAVLSGTYTVTVTAGNGCTTVGNFTIPENIITPVINGAPTAASSCVVDNGAVDLTVGPATGYTFLWSEGSTTEDLSGIAAGSYTVTVNGGGTCTGTASFIISDQTTQPQAGITAGNTVLDCSITSTTLTGSVSGTPNASSFQWSSNGNPLGTGNTLNVNAPGQYDLVVQDNVTSCTASASISVSQNLNPPQLSIASPNLLTCATPSQTITGSSTVSGVQFSWATISGTDTTIVGTGATLSVSSTGTYFLLGVNPANNCVNATSVNVLADQTPPAANAGPTFTLDCAGETAPLNGSGTGAANLTYQWTSQDGHFVSGAGTANPLIDKAGTYQLLVTNPANGCTDTDLVTIEPEVPVAYASVLQPSCLELEGTVQIDSVTGLSEPILYSLNNSQPVAQNQFANLVPGIYTISVQGGNGCTATVEATVDAPDLVEITLAPEAQVVLGHSYLLDAQVNIPNANIASVTWIPGLGLECDTCLSTLATPFTTTDYQILVISKNGCEARGTLTLTVDKSHHVFGPNIFSPNGDGINDVFTLLADPVTVAKVKSLQVFSRWGEAVYERNDFSPVDDNIGWDGTFKGQKLNPAVFVWQAVVQFVDGQEELFTGDVTLKR